MHWCYRPRTARPIREPSAKADQVDDSIAPIEQSGSLFIAVFTCIRLHAAVYDRSQYSRPWDRVGRERELKSMDGKIKAPTVVGRMWLVGLDFSTHRRSAPAGASRQFINDFNVPTAIRVQKASCLIELP
jgi:hypothetical protein